MRKGVKSVSLKDVERMKFKFDSFSKKVERKQKFLSSRHQIMDNKHAQFRDKINKHMNYYSK